MGTIAFPTILHTFLLENIALTQYSTNMRQVNAQLIESYLVTNKEEEGKGELIRLAAKSNVSPTLIRSLVKGNYKARPKYDTLVRLAEAMNVELDDLYPRCSEGKGAA